MEMIKSKIQKFEAPQSKCKSKNGPQNGPESDPKSVFGPIFGSIFGSLLGPFWEPTGPQDGPGRGQEEPKRTKWGSERPKGRLSKKVDFASDCLHFFALETPQDGPKRPRRLPRSIPRELRSLKKEPRKQT